MKTIYLAKYKRIREGCNGTIEDFDEGEVFFEQVDDAEKAVRLEGRVKSNLLIAVPEEITVYESFDEYQKIVDERLREEAMRKLTPEQKRVLGLTEENKEEN